MIAAPSPYFVTPGLTRGPAYSARIKTAGPRLKAGVTGDME